MPGYFYAPDIFAKTTIGYLEKIKVIFLNHNVKEEKI